MADFKFEGFDIEGIKQQVLHSAEEKLNREVGTLSCPEHGPQRVTVRLVTSGNQPAFEGGCCDRFRQIVEDRIRRVLQ